MKPFLARLKARHFIIAAAVVFLCVAAGLWLLAYIEPQAQAAQIYDFSLGRENEAWGYDQKGWTLFTQKGDERSLLTANGFTGFSGAEPGQTFYCSRLMTEEVGAPVLRLKTSGQSVAVFLDDALLYSDSPELDNRIGWLDLPMRPEYSDRDVTITLPGNYLGRTLTIAQSSDLSVGEIKNGCFYVMPVEVNLCNAFAYENNLVTSSFLTAAPMALALAASALLLGVFLRQTAKRQPESAPLFGALLLLFWPLERLLDSGFFYNYFGEIIPDPATALTYLGLLLVFVYLAVRLTGKRRRLLWLFGGAQLVLMLITAAMQLFGYLSYFVYAWLYLDRFLTACMIAEALACSCWEWRHKGNRFLGLFFWLTAAGIALYLAAIVFSALAGGQLARETFQALGVFWFGSIDRYLLRLLLVCATAAAVWETLRGELARRTELQLLLQRQELEAQSYENMRRQHEEVMMLRHDMAKHFLLLRQMTHDPQTADYLDGLIGQNEKIRSVVQSGNIILDTILNTGISRAEKSNIAVEIVRMQVPEQLPLSDTDLSSLVMNLLDNALEGAAASGCAQPYIRIDFYISGNFFMIEFENSANLAWIQKESAPAHGFGLKIIRQTAERSDGLVDTEYGANFYRAAAAFPLAHVNISSSNNS